jgi:nucleoid-associated protein YgaU
MKIKGKFVTLLSVSLILLLVFSASVFGQDERKIKMDEYKIQLAEYQTREADADTKLAELQAEIDDLNKQITDTQAQIDGNWDEIYTSLGTDEEGVEAYRNNLADIENQIDGLASLTPEDLFRRKDEVCDLQKQIEDAKASNIALLTEMENKIGELDSKVAALRANMPANIFDQYTVIRGDYLWKIAKMPDIYDNPYQWIRIYCVNKDQIKDPDLIFPDQVFNIARGVGINEHLVVDGEWLSKIAGMADVYNDPTKWTNIYEANKDIIADPHVIYPYQVLTLPKE